MPKNSDLFSLTQVLWACFLMISTSRLRTDWWWGHSIICGAFVTASFLWWNAETIALKKHKWKLAWLTCLHSHMFVQSPLCHYIMRKTRVWINVEGCFPAALLKKCVWHTMFNDKRRHKWCTACLSDTPYQHSKKKHSSTHQWRLCRQLFFNMCMDM